MKTGGQLAPTFFLKVEHCHGQTSRFDNEIGFFQEFFSEKPSLSCIPAIYAFIDWLGWKVLIKSEILITTGMIWPLKSDKCKAP